jgi:hypothetical protein
MLRKHLTLGMAPFAALMDETRADRLGAPLSRVGWIARAVIFAVKLPTE